MIYLNCNPQANEQTAYSKGARNMVEDYRSNAELFIEGAEQAARRHWPVLAVEGVALVLFGILALFIPSLITLGIASALGWVFLSAGAAAILMHFRLYRAQGLRYLLFSAALSTIAGLALLVKPVSGVISLTVMIILFWRRGDRETHISAGAFSISPELSRMDQGKWHYRSHACSADVWGPPRNGAWAPGLLLGTNMILGGVALIVIALVERRKPTSSALDQIGGKSVG